MRSSSFCTPRENSSCLSAMEELMKTLEGRQEEEKDEEPADVSGLLAVHIATMRIAKEDIEPSMVDLLQLRMSYRGQTKYFPISYTTGDPHVNSHETRHLPIQLPKDCECPGNLVSLELLIKSPLLQDHGSVLAQATLHIHSIIYDSPLVGECELREESGEVFAVLSGEFVFTYGMFGFGESFQLHHPVHKPGYFLHHSMFPRLAPPELRVDINCMLTPLPTAHPSFIPFTKKTTLSVHEPSSASLHPKPRLLVEEMTRLNSLRRDLQQKKGRQQKLAFLQELFVKRPDASSHLDIQVTTRNQRASAT